MKNEFPVSIYGKLEKFTDTISRARVRTFYKGLNRNSTYITEEFAEKLINTLSYAPVKGIYDGEDSNYTDHGKKRNKDAFTVLFQQIKILLGKNILMKMEKQENMLVVMFFFILLFMVRLHK